MVDFNFRLSQQGPQGKQGPQGEKGEDGITPIFYEGTNTPTEYTLTIDYGNGNTSSTGNLRPPVTNNGGTYLRYDNGYVIGTPDYADLNRNPGEVVLASVADVANNDAEDSDAVSIELRNADLTAIDNRFDAVEGDVTTLQTDKADKSTTYTKTEVDNALAGKANTSHTHTVSQITNAGALASKDTVNYNTDVTNKPTLGTLAGKNTVDYVTEVTNKPTIPTVGNGTITITQGGVSKGTFTTNQSGNSTIALDAGGGGGGTSFTTGTGLELTAQDVLNVKIDGSTITTNNNGQLVASSSAPSNMVTTDTAQNITGIKTFEANIKLYSIESRFGYGRILLQDYSTGHISIGSETTGITLYGSGDRPFYRKGYGQSKYLALLSDVPNKMLKKTITQASANVSEVGGTVTVTDADVTTSTIVNLYPTDTTTETWLENNLSSTIITEGTGSFTFDISSSLPSTFSMYYTITEVS